MSVLETIQAIDIAAKAGFISNADASRLSVIALTVDQEANDLALEFNQVNFEAIKPKTADSFPKITIASNV